MLGDYERFLAKAHPKRRVMSYEEFLAKAKDFRLRRKARVVAAEGSHTEGDLEAIRERQGDQCVYCSAPLNGKGSRDHIVALIRGGSNYPENMQLLCKRCSDFKGSKLERQFLDEFRALSNGP